MGALAGGAMTGLLYTAIIASSEGAGGPFDVIFGWLFISFIAFFAWVVGIIFVGAPPWFILHHLGWHQWYFSVGLGAILAPLPIFASLGTLFDAQIPAFSIFGGGVGWIIGRIVYTKAATSPPGQS